MRSTHEQVHDEVLRQPTALFIFGIVGLFAFLALYASSKSYKPPATTTATTTNTKQPTQPTTKQLVAAWYTKYHPYITTLAADINQWASDAQNNHGDTVGDSVLLATSFIRDCKQIKTDVGNAQQLPAIPDTQAANDFSSALTYLATSADDCYNGSINSDSKTLERATTEIQQYTTKIKATTADLTNLGIPTNQ